jgi:hypothetical protein
VLRRIGPESRPSTARSTARPTAGRQRDQDDFAALADDPQHTVAVLLTEIADVGAGCLEDPKTEQAEHRDQGEVVGV